MATLTLTPAMFEAAVGAPLTDFAADCHSASLALVRSGIFTEPCRVARGTCRGVPGQHSWAVLSHDAYDTGATVVDATLWSYDTTVPGVWIGKPPDRPHVPHGTGSIWKWGRPTHHGGETIVADTAGLTADALLFLEILGPLDYRGWAQLAHAPVGGWPAGEIIAAMYANKKLRELIPIDIVGMATDLNPGGLYLAT